MKIWVAVAPDGAIVLPDEGGRGNTWKKRAIQAARERATLDVELREQTDFLNYISWAETRAEGWKVRQADVVLTGRA